jgi:hypothetical protein
MSRQKRVQMSHYVTFPNTRVYGEKLLWIRASSKLLSVTAHSVHSHFTFMWPCIVTNFLIKNRLGALISQIYFGMKLYIRAGSGWSCSNAVLKPVWHTPLLIVQWITPNDGQRKCPKHVEFHSKIIWEISESSWFYYKERYIRSLPYASDGHLVQTQPEQALGCGDNGFTAHGSLTSFGKVKFTLKHVMQAQTGSKGIAPLVL